MPLISNRTLQMKLIVNGVLYVLKVISAAKEVEVAKELSEFAESFGMTTIDADHAHCGRERCAWPCVSQELSRASAPVARRRHGGVPSEENVGVRGGRTG
jgi:hypothetical protein